MSGYEARHLTDENQPPEVEVMTADEWIAQMPKHLRIGCFTFTIEVYAPRNLDRGDEFGYSIFGDRLIGLRQDLGIEQMANTFIHEVIHCIHWVYGLITAENPSEEQYTEMTANGLCAFWQDNPVACEWWSHSLEVERSMPESASKS